MGLLDDAIREHLDLKRRRGADPSEIERAERDALGPVRRSPEELGSEVSEAEPSSHEGEEYDYDSDPDVAEHYVEEFAPPEHSKPAEHDSEPAAPLPVTEEHDADLELSTYEDAATEHETPHEHVSEPPASDASIAEPPPPHPDPEPPTPHAAAEPLAEPPAPHPDAESIAEPPAPHPARETPLHDGGETVEYDVEGESEPEGDEMLEETPEFLQDTPEHDRLWFEQRPPRDFDFDD